MKRILLMIALLSAAAAACGSATEVGNPTAEVPRTITGMIDTEEYAAIEVTSLSVVAESTDGDLIIAPVETDGSFTMEVSVGKTYAFHVSYQGMNIGDFSFEQDDQGGRANRLEITAEGDPIDMGQIRYQEGAFIPENEPRQHMGGGSPGGA